MISIVCVYNNENVLKNGLLRSLENQTQTHELFLMDNTQGKYNSAAEALNWGGLAKGKYIVFVHQDVVLDSNSWLENTEKLLDSIPNLGIAGVAGARSSKTSKMNEIVTNIKQGTLAENISECVPNCVPAQGMEKVQTVDECLVIIPKRVFDILRFDEKVCDNWHLYAIDYSLSVAHLELGVYVSPEPIYHGSTGIPNKNILHTIFSMGYLPVGYYQTLGKILKKHRRHTRRVYATTGCWNTLYPLALQRLRVLPSDLRVLYWRPRESRKVYWRPLKWRPWED